MILNSKPPDLASSCWMLAELAEADARSLLS